MWNFILWYFILGFIVMGIEWTLLYFSKSGIFDSNEGLLMKVLVFLIEVVIWPRQLFLMIRGTIRFYRGTLTDEDHHLIDD